MKRILEALALAIGVFILGAATSLAWAQANRTWVSGVGDDADPCSRTSPCQTFNGAIFKTMAGGQINAVDAIDQIGSTIISKAITIDGGGATIMANGSTGFIANAGPNDVVVLRNLSINGIGTGVNGIRFNAGGTLHVENMQILGSGMTGGGVTGNGIDFNPSGNSKLFVSNSSIRDNAFVGIYVRPIGSANAQVTLNHVQLENNTTGLFVSDGGSVSVVDSVATGNAGTGFQAASSARPAIIQLERSVSSNNGTFGARTDGPFSQIWLSNSTITSNFIGLASAGGNIVTFSNNAIASNFGGDGSPTIAVTLR